MEVIPKGIAGAGSIPGVQGQGFEGKGKGQRDETSYFHLTC